MTIDLSRPTRFHIVGIGGAGMSAIAKVLVSMGHRVSGSDTSDSAALAVLRGVGVEVSMGHAAVNVGDAELVAMSSAIDRANVEIAAAQDAGVPVLRRAEILQAITRIRRTIAVSGTHGKTTTTAMIATLLREAGWDPSFIVGGNVLGLDTSAIWSDAEWIVVEADESDGTFLVLDTELAVVTNIEPYHLDHYGSFERLIAAFDGFMSGARKTLVCTDDPVAARVGGMHGAIGYGTSPESDYVIEVTSANGLGSHFVLSRDSARVAEVDLAVPGLHNVHNAAGALAVALELGVDPSVAAKSLEKFNGVRRRFEVRGELDGVTYVDDYAHLPSEIAATIAAARLGDWRRVIVVFQPHRYSRTESLWREFAHAFSGVDLLVVTDVYAAGEATRSEVTGKLIVDAVLDTYPGARVAYMPQLSDVVSYLRLRLRPGDVCLTLGAGDITTLSDSLLVPIR